MAEAESKSGSPAGARTDAPRSAEASPRGDESPLREDSGIRDPNRNFRLRVEIRIFALLALLWELAFIGGAIWYAGAARPDEVVGLPWGTTFAVHGILMSITLGAAYLRMPKTRWARAESIRPPPRLVWLAALGAPALALYPLAKLRDDRARKERPSPEDYEHAFRELCLVPRALALRLFVGLALAGLISARIQGNALGLPQSIISGTAMAWLAGCGLIAAIAASRCRALLRGEYLSAPRPDASAIPVQEDLRIRLGFPASLAAVGVVLGPIGAAMAYQGTLAWHEQLDLAERRARRTLTMALSDNLGAVGRATALDPSLGVLLGERNLGETIEHPERRGALDLNGDATVDHLQLGKDEVVVSVPVEPGSPHTEPLWLFLALSSTLLTLSLGRLVVRVRNDVQLATTQVERIAKREIPEPLASNQLSTGELHNLVLAVDRLVSRIAEANVAKYVAIERAQEADRLKSQFLANMSHDLRSPLNSILGFSELLLTGIDGPLDEENTELIEMIQQSGRELLQQIDDILDTAQLEAGRMSLVGEPTPPATLISRAIQKARPRLPDGVELETRAAAGIPPAYIDPHRSVQALANVISFAASSRQAPTIEVTAALGRGERGRAVFVVVHTPHRPATAHQLQQVLKGFVRIPGHRGLGLSLPIAGSILELQGGSLRIEERSEGMDFILEFPAAERRIRLRVDPNAPSRPRRARPPAKERMASRRKDTRLETPAITDEQLAELDAAREAYGNEERESSDEPASAQTKGGPNSEPPADEGSNPA